MSQAKRTFLLVVFVLAAMVIGLSLGTVIGGRYFVPPGSGLAGPAIALGYGVMGAAAALVLALVAIRYVPRQQQARLGIPVLLVGMALVVVIALGIARSRDQQNAALQEAYAQTRPFTVKLRHEPGSGATDFAVAELSWGDRREVAVTRPDGQRCVAELSPRQASSMLVALRDVEGLLFRDEFPCAGSVGDVERRLEFTIVEAMPPNNSGDLAITAACAADHPMLDEVFAAARRIIDDPDHPLECGS